LFTFIMYFLSSLCLFSFFFYSYVDPRNLHSFPTRRSSDLVSDSSIRSIVSSSTRPCLASSALVCEATEFTTSSRNSPIRSKQYRSEEHTSELQSRRDLVCRLLLEKKKRYQNKM